MSGVESSSRERVGSPPLPSVTQLVGLCCGLSTGIYRLPANVNATSKFLVKGL